MKRIWFMYTTELFMYVFVPYLGRRDMLIVLYMILIREPYYSAWFCCMLELHYKLEDILEIII